MNARDFLTELHLAQATSELPLSALVRAVDPGREELAQELERGRGPREVFAGAGLMLIGGPLALLAVTAAVLLMVTRFYLKAILPLFHNVLGEGASGFEGMWQVQIAFWLLLLITVGCFLLGAILLVVLFFRRPSGTWFVTRLLPSAERVDRLDRLGTEIRLSREERARQLHYAAESNGGEWAAFIPVFVLWIAPTVVMTIFLPLIKLVTSLQT